MLVEKPMAPDIVGCNALIAASQTSGAVLAVNQNQVYHPAFQRLLAAVHARMLGPPRFISSIYQVPLRQLSAGQFGHWMFDAPVNLLLEQAVHPLSQLVMLAGPVETVRAQRGRPIEPGPGRFVYPTIDAVMTCRDLPCQFHFAVGEAFPFWQVTVACEDGVFVADMIGDRLLSHARTRWLEPLDVAVAGTQTAVRLARESWRNAGRYVAVGDGARTAQRPVFSGNGETRTQHEQRGFEVPPGQSVAIGVRRVHVLPTPLSSFTACASQCRARRGAEPPAAARRAGDAHEDAHRHAHRAAARAGGGRLPGQRTFVGTTVLASGPDVRRRPSGCCAAARATCWCCPRRRAPRSAC